MQIHANMPPHASGAAGLDPSVEQPSLAAGHMLSHQLQPTQAQAHTQAQVQALQQLLHTRVQPAADVDWHSNLSSLMAASGHGAAPRGGPGHTVQSPLPWDSRSHPGHLDRLAPEPQAAANAAHSLQQSLAGLSQYQGGGVPFGGVGAGGAHGNPFQAPAAPAAAPPPPVPAPQQHPAPPIGLPAAAGPQRPSIECTVLAAKQLTESDVKHSRAILPRVAVENNLNFIPGYRTFGLLLPDHNGQEWEFVIKSWANGRSDKAAAARRKDRRVYVVEQLAPYLAQYRLSVGDLIGIVVYDGAPPLPCLLPRAAACGPFAELNLGCCGCRGAGDALQHGTAQDVA